MYVVDNSFQFPRVTKIFKIS